MSRPCRCFSVFTAATFCAFGALLSAGTHAEEGETSGARAQEDEQLRLANLNAPEGRTHEAAEDAGLEDDRREADRCTALLGSPGLRRRHAKERAESGLRVSEAGEFIDIHATGDVYAPPRVQPLESLTVVGVEERDHGPDIALLSLDDADAWGCDDTIAVQQDDALGSNARVVAITSDGLLAEVDDGLVFVALDQDDAPQFRMVWHSDFEVVKQSPKVKKRKKKRRKRRKRRRRRRRR